MGPKRRVSARIQARRGGRQPNNTNNVTGVNRNRVENDHIEDQAENGGNNGVGNNQNDQANNQENVANGQGVQQPLAQLAPLLQALTGLIQAQQQNPLAGGAPVRQNSELAEFKKHTSATFSGNGGPIAAEDWVQEMEKTFNGMRCAEANKVPCATFMLKEGAYDWWLMEKRKHENDEFLFTWEDFKVAFYEKYFPRSEQIQRENDFIKLTQRGKSVSEYEAEFARLAKFAPTYVATEENRVRRFEEGLRPAIKRGVMPFDLKTYKDVVSKALLVERGLNEVQSDWDDKQRKRDRPTNSQNNKDLEGVPKRQNSTTCNKCGGNHSTDTCYWTTGSCFNCGKKGHKIEDCPEPIKKGKQSSNENKGESDSKRTGRMYSMTTKDDDDANWTVAGTLSLED